MSREWELVEREIAYQGYFRLARYSFRHSLFNGGWSPVISREVFERGHAAALLPYDPVRDEVALIEQFRVGALDAPGGPWLLEFIAGIIEPGETAEEVVRREAVEEAGCTVDLVERICEYLVSPGGTTESTALYIGRADLANVEGVHGLAEENEDIRVQVVGADEAIALADSGRITNAMGLIGLNWFARHRERLHREWRTP
ncbi:MAG: ADP-ribose diphosphatase [Halofilum sp. (in: g-proteobacteria)]